MHSCCKGRDGGGVVQIADDEMEKIVEQRYEDAVCQRGPRQRSEERGPMVKACVCV